MSEHTTKTEESSHRHLALVLEAYLKGEDWVTEDRFSAEIEKYHSPDELQLLLTLKNYAYLLQINPEKLEKVRKRFLP